MTKKEHYCSAYNENDTNPYGCKRCSGRKAELDWEDVYFTDYQCFRY